MIHPSRLRVLAEHDPHPRAAYVLYWMQASQRTRFNHALEHAVARANELRLPVLVAFGLTDDYPEANARHYAFMLRGLADVDAALRERGIGFVLRRGHPPRVAVELAGDAALIVCDRGYTRHQKAWRDHVADRAGRTVVEVESDVVVPVEAASEKQEHAARTIRPKLHKRWSTYLAGLRQTPVKVRLARRGEPASDLDPQAPIAETLAKLKVDRSVTPSSRFVGGEAAGQERLSRFVRTALAGYADGRRDPAADGTSALSAYLHFGQVSPLDVALQVLRALPAKDPVRHPHGGAAAFLEELLVRRELAVNYVHHAPRYDQYAGIPAWAQQTLRAHRRDRRPHVYTLRRLEAADTHDPYWNAAQTEMNRTGYMHNSLRMYWGKKVLEWSPTPEDAYVALLHLNNRHFLCGRGPSAFANVGWTFGLHDRPWGPERPIFGTVRYMNAAGLERKFDMKAYVEKVARL